MSTSEDRPYRYSHDFKELFDKALVESCVRSRRLDLGFIAVGKVVAAWEPEEGNFAILEERAARLRSGVGIAKEHLTIVEVEEPRALVTHYWLDLARTTLDGVTRHLVPKATTASVHYAWFRGWWQILTDAPNDWSAPTEDDRERLFTELQRGASGNYALLPEDKP